MNQQTFEREMLRAKAFIVAGDRADYWHGYQRGLRRGFHGESFGTAAEHQTWLALIGDDDPARQARGAGYRDGLACCGETSPHPRAPG